MPTSGFWVTIESGSGRHGSPSSIDRAMAWPIAHSPVDSSDTSTTVASPVRSRWNSAPMIPPAMASPPRESPNPGPGEGGVSAWPSRMTPIATPARE